MEEHLLESAEEEITDTTAYFSNYIPVWLHFDSLCEPVLVREHPDDY